MYPAPPVIEFSPKPGDTLNYSVTFAKGVYTLSIQDPTSGESFSVNKLCAATCSNNSAQVTAGPAAGVSPANFIAVNFAVIIVTDNAGVSGGLKIAPDALLENAHTSYEQSRELLRKWHNRGSSRYANTPRFAPTSSARRAHRFAGRPVRRLRG